MEGWLKGLIACACVVVIAGGGYYASGEWTRSTEAAEREVCAERAGSVAKGISYDDDITVLKRCMFSGYMALDGSIIR